MASSLVIDGIEYAAEIESDGEYVGDPVELRGTNALITNAECPDCGIDTEWEVDFVGPDKAVASCICGREWPVQS